MSREKADWLEKVNSGGEELSAIAVLNNSNHNAIQEEGPPSLGYEMTARRKRSLIWQLTLIASINSLAPTLIYYLYKHLAGNYQRNPALTYTWVTLALGTLELFQHPYRTYFLYRDNFARSGDPLGQERRTGWAKIRPYLTHQDFFGLHFFLCIVIGAIGLTLCCSLGGTRGSFPLLVISIPTVVLYLGLILGLTSVCTALKIKTPFRMSSLPAGQPFRPAFYFLWEDLVAVDGGGGFAFRRRISKRYEASPPFQRLMQHLTLFFFAWAVILFLVALALVVANVQRGLNEDIVYGIIVGFSIVWSGIVAVFAGRFAVRSLREEKKWWKQNHLKQKVDGDVAT
jgi:uncharacterized membrane protein (DUF485 family)